MHYITRTAAVFSAAMLLATTAYAGGGHGATHKHHQSTVKLSKKLRNDPAVKAYMAANQKMHKDMDITYSGHADVDFVRGMIPHHQGAIDMAYVQLRYGKDENLKTLARWIIVNQEAEIGFMKSWLNGRDSDWVAEGACGFDSVKSYKEAMNIMHRDMNIQYTGDADVDFVRGMIPHHQGAVDMSWVLRRSSMYPELRKLADNIIASQQQEIAYMKSWDTHRTPLPLKSLYPVK